MATLKIAEYRELARDANGQMIPVGKEPAVALQAVTISSTSAQSAAFNSATTFVALHSDTDCSIIFGDDPTAVLADHFTLKAGQEIYRGVRAGQKVAAITA